MKINQFFLEKISPILTELKQKIGTDFVVFGSAPLYLFGVLEFAEETKINDLDIAIKNERDIPKEAQVVFFHNDPKQKFYKLLIKNVNVDIGTAWPGQERYFKKIFKNPVIIKGFKFANLSICQEWKELMVKKYDREKDKYYLSKIQEFRHKNNFITGLI